MLNVADHRIRPKSFDPAKKFYKTIGILKIVIKKLCIITDILI